jgi:hypothetical protein
MLVMEKVKLSIVSLIIFASSRSHAQFTSDDFGTQFSYNTLTYPLAVKTADLDGDGKPDMVVANQGGNKISVFRNTVAAGRIDATSFAARQDFDLSALVGPESLSLNDIDGDGKTDIIVSNFNDKTIAVLLNTSVSGTISFSAKVNVTIGYYAHAIAVGDVDGDGKADIAVSNYGASSVTIYRNNSTTGTVAFLSGYDIICGGAPGALTFADLTGDSKAELLVLLSDNAQLVVYKNKAVSGTINAASFEAPVYKYAGQKPGAIAVSDINADGKQDVMITDLVADAHVLVYKNTYATAISFDMPVLVPVAKNPFSIAVADLDNDGKPDVIVTSWNSAGVVSVLRNVSAASGVPTFSSKVDFAVGANPQSVAVADLNADGKKDIIVANSFDNTVGILKKI